MLNLPSAITGFFQKPFFQKPFSCFSEFRRLAAVTGAGVLSLALLGCAGSPEPLVRKSSVDRPTAAPGMVANLAIQPVATRSAVPLLRHRLHALLEQRQSQLNGMSEFDLVRDLGAPNLRRRDGTAEIWQYLGQECVLHVFLYRIGNAQSAHVRFWTVSGRQLSKGSQRGRPQSGNNVNLCLEADTSPSPPKDQKTL